MAVQYLMVRSVLPALQPGSRHVHAQLPAEALLQAGFAGNPPHCVVPALLCVRS